MQGQGHYPTQPTQGQGQGQAQGQPQPQPQRQDGRVDGTQPSSRIPRGYSLEESTPAYQQGGAYHQTSAAYPTDASGAYQPPQGQRYRGNDARGQIPPRSRSTPQGHSSSSVPEQRMAASSGYMMSEIPAGGSMHPPQNADTQSRTITSPHAFSGMNQYDQYQNYFQQPQYVAGPSYPHPSHYPPNLQQWGAPQPQYMMYQASQHQAPQHYQAYGAPKTAETMYSGSSFQYSNGSTRPPRPPTETAATGPSDIDPRLLAAVNAAEFVPSFMAQPQSVPPAVRQHTWPGTYYGTARPEANGYHQPEYEEPSEFAGYTSEDERNMDEIDNAVDDLLDLQERKLMVEESELNDEDAKMMDQLEESLAQDGLL